ncbi:hypothetical protein [Chroococcidiopsis thermalis]|jgi:hypothetical protein|uniref:Uncharacterized protein n=1 Tax=Chroococcidiopsis thermalis (strain PCC 7203) TaxID=251229 RepID=K9U6M2_CHRTP|nr:hypothetical protein [Chroococcidiopsis thermalis]AFY90076.1 hypothetical protein Chro_4690 [Chroococcidiopsis thermalis PCC 7203]PSB45565.1 hypothetical protein C7B80_16490 [Cyanosarcina cf. burmensis CCALA 770]
MARRQFHSSELIGIRLINRENVFIYSFPIILANFKHSAKIHLTTRNTSIACIESFRAAEVESQILFFSIYEIDKVATSFYLKVDS